MTHSRRQTVGLLAIAMAAALGASSSAWAGLRSDMVFTSSNAAEGNELLVYARAGGQGLSLVTHAMTGGLGAGMGLGSQGAVTLSHDGRFVFVVNAGSNSVSTFKLAGDELQLMSTVDSGGMRPISVTEHDGKVYVLNAGGDGNVAGFRNRHGELRPVAGSIRGLSVAGTAGPAQVGLSADGDALVVTEKATNTITSYSVNSDGSLGEPQFTASPGMTPFGFAFNKDNHLAVTEAVGGAPGASTVSSYRFADSTPATPHVVSSAVPDNQGAACWVAFTPAGRYAYVTNTASSNVSSYRMGWNGSLSLMAAVAAGTGEGSAPQDDAVSADGKHLYVLNGKTATISSFKVMTDGSLVVQPLTTGLPATAVGMAAN